MRTKGEGGHGDAGTEAVIEEDEERVKGSSSSGGRHRCDVRSSEGWTKEVMGRSGMLGRGGGQVMV